MRDLGSETMVRRAQGALTDGMLGKANNGEAVFRAYITTDYAKFEADYQAHWHKLEAEWKRLIQPIYESIRASNARR